MLFSSCALNLLLILVPCWAARESVHEATIRAASVKQGVLALSDKDVVQHGEEEGKVRPSTNEITALEASEKQVVEHKVRPSTNETNILVVSEKQLLHQGEFKCCKYWTRYGNAFNSQVVDGYCWQHFGWAGTHGSCNSQSYEVETYVDEYTGMSHTRTLYVYGGWDGTYDEQTCAKLASGYCNPARA
eukprot:gnl/TRDRNA2_/TRDRNA2_92207_c0_seq1.p1 gnl/TRDRNA2_/TRDRNA2_92207_c0~~gnl/TRDRNA2_/TRDRNA2_92207_c0_seq1.p1  ORF type:complete len:188 (+),score=26.13 gnl/TRDRNA2_/TRDRNA2_92207_c0_seq1:2-565(+)